MSTTQWDDRFLASTKGRILALLRRGGRTVDELAAAVELSDNAIRPHLAALERDGIVRQRGARPTGGKPAAVYKVTPDAERLFTRAYIPLLTELVRTLSERMTSAELEALLRESAGGWPRPEDPRRATSALAPRLPPPC